MLTNIELGCVRNLVEYLNLNTGMDKIHVEDINVIDCNGDRVAVVGYDPGIGEYALLEAPRC